MVRLNIKAKFSLICCLSAVSFYLIFVYKDVSVCVCEKCRKADGGSRFYNHDAVAHISPDARSRQGIGGPVSYLESGEIDTSDRPETLHFNGTDTNTNHSTKFILLVTYGRSGSSWLGNITGQAENTFYVFEPFQRTLPQGYFKENFVCFNNNTCRNPQDKIERYTTILATVYQLFTCQSSKLHPFLQDIFIRNLRSRQHVETLRKCLNISSVETCLPEIDFLCSLTSHRILKTIRISMELVRIMMKMWQNLKVIHLVRDPRAITHSRLQLNAFSMSRNILSHSQDLCTRMKYDSLISLQLQKLYPNRLKVVSYEALAERPIVGAKYVYKFLNMSFNENVFHSIIHSISTKKTRNSEYPYLTVRYNSSAVAKQWRLNMSLLQVQVIDYFCKDMYSVLGYIAINSTDELRSLSTPLRRSIDIDGFL
ncbi:carbohydrate sulfotransferase 1-like [Mercenaria mercenaria]|uniref:carbohydrate sulfotransferase 1-like n=1 Tax=Mercenaria mercenaria TaxID=6596 RepID=UPI00234F3EF3|nr:carbohydrate sulfotransferase 1-like [Mercenaria mercenaria]